MLEAMCGALEPARAAVDLIIVDDAHIRRINREYRSDDRPTDVISFSYLEGGAGSQRKDASFEPGDDLAGEIYVSYETLEKEATAQGIELKNLFLRIGVHGLLHIVGYDHGTDSETRKMEDMERKVLGEHLRPSEIEALFPRP